MGIWEWDKVNIFNFKTERIYFGLNMDEMHQIQIIEGLTNRDIRFYKM